MQALEFRHQIQKYILSRAAYTVQRKWWSVKLAPLYLVEKERPVPEHPGWVRLGVSLSGICGSDLSALTGSESLYMEPEASFPFVPGHELTGTVEALGPGAGAEVQPGTRVAVWPVIGCEARNIKHCRHCARGWSGLCENRNVGWPDHGLSVGFNSDTGGGWSEACLVHHSQLWELPDSVSDEDAVVLDAAASALAAVLRNSSPEVESTLVIGGGTIGLLAAYLHRALRLPGEVALIARHAFQQEWAERNGIPVFVLRSEEAFRDWSSDRGVQSRKITGYGYAYRGVFDRVVVAAGSPSSFDWAMRAIRPGGKISLLNAPARLSLDPTPLWYREVALEGTYAYGPVPWRGRQVHPFSILLDGLEQGRLSFRSLVTHAFPLASYREAIDAALARGNSGAIKVAFKPG